MLRRLMYTSDPYEPDCTVGLYETEEQRQYLVDEHVRRGVAQWSLSEDYFRNQLFDEEIQIGVYYP